MAETGERLLEILSAFVSLARSGSTDDLRALLDEGIVWQGVLPELVCHSRREVMALLGRRAAGFPRITTIEAREIGDRVVVCVGGPDFTASPAEGQLEPSGDPRWLVFTFADDKVVRMESFTERATAYASSGVTQA
jgi:hypothetical protein